MEVIYDPSMEMLAVLSKTMKENYEMLPKLDDDGEIIHSKKSRASGKKFKEERRLVKVPQEYYLIERAEQEEFIKEFAVNADTYNWKQYLDAKLAGSSNIIQEVKPEAGVITDKAGKPLTAVK